MVTQYSIKILSYHVKWGNFWGSIPFDWDGATKSGEYLRYTSSKWLRIKWWGLVTYAYFIVLYHIGRAVYESQYGENSINVFKSVIYILALSNVTIVATTIIFKTTEFEFCVNACIHTTVLWRKRYLKKVYQQRDPLVELVLTLGFLVALTYPIPFGGGIFILPREHFFLTELITPGHFTMFNFLPLAILHIWYIFWSFSVAQFLVAVAILLCPNVALFCGEISLSGRNYKSHIELRNPESMINVYRALQIISVEGNALVSGLLLAMQFVLKRQIYISNVAMAFCHLPVLVRLLLGIWAVLMMSIWGAVLFTTAMFYDTSKECLKTWKTSTPQHWSLIDKMLFAKFRKSCCPIKLRIGSYSFVQKDKQMKFLYSVSKGTMEALLAYEKTYNN